MSRPDFWVKYLSEKHKYMDGQMKEAGPVVTISREHGCFGFHVAQHIIRKIREITEHNGTGKLWECLNKEVMQEAAADLQTHPERIEQIFKHSDKSSIDNFFESMVKHTYATDKQILDILKQVVNAQAWEGNVVIIGRAAATLTQNIKKSLNIRLVAPQEHRVKQIVKLKGIDEKEAISEVKDADKKRYSFMKLFTKQKDDNYLYDLTINTTKFEEEEIADIIVRTAQAKGLF